VIKINIAVVGYNNDLSLKAARELATNDMDSEIVLANKNTIMMKDGTHYIPIGNANQIRGCRYDQIILVDDERWEVLVKRANDINEVRLMLSGTLDGSPYETQHYEW
jgi:adenylate kinase